MRLGGMSAGLATIVNSSGNRSANRNAVAPTPEVLTIDFYVSPTGNDDTGDGSELNPYRTFANLPRDCVIGMLPGGFESSSGDWSGGLNTGSISLVTSRSDDANKTMLHMFRKPGDVLNGRVFNDWLSNSSTLGKAILNPDWISAHGSNANVFENNGCSIIRTGELWSTWIYDTDFTVSTRIYGSQISAINTYVFGIDFYFFESTFRNQGFGFFTRTSGNCLFDTCWIEWYPVVDSGKMVIAGDTIAGFNPPVFVNCDFDQYNGDVTQVITPGDAVLINSRILS